MYTKIYFYPHTKLLISDHKAKIVKESQLIVNIIKLLGDYNIT